MKKSFYIIALLLTTLSSFAQIKDTIIKIGQEEVVYDMDLRLTYVERRQALKEFVTAYEESLKAAQPIKNLFSSIPLSNDPCLNHSFESAYANWTGLSLKHATQQLPIENGLALNPGILPLPFTNTGMSGKYTDIQTTGPDPLIPGLQTTSNISPSTSSIRLGNNQPGWGAEGIAKRFVVTSANSTYYFQYAVVMDPSHSMPDGSMNGSEVFFIAEAIDQSGNTVDKIVEVGNPTNPFISQVSTTAGTKYYRDWRCASLDLSSHIGQEVMLMFINSDCSAGGHEGYTYLDETCTSCTNVNEGSISLNLDPDNCIEFPQSVNGSFTLPNNSTVSNVNITLYIYQNSILINTVTSPSISGTNYQFTLTPGDIPNHFKDPCFDVVAKLSFDIQDIQGNTTTVERWSSDVSGPNIEGALGGLNNDLCFCTDCCETPLDIVASPTKPIKNTSSQGVDYATTSQTFTINTASSIPISEMRVAVTDLVFNYNYEQCAQCVDNPALWGSIQSPTAQIGSSPQALQKENLPYFSNNLLTGFGNTREVIWSNANGTMLQAGDTFDISYYLPPASEIPCCVTKVIICLEISWKDANCKMCTQYVCAEIRLSGEKQ